MLRRTWFAWAVAVGVAVTAARTPAADDITRALATIKTVSREGKGNDAAGEAWKVLVAKGRAALLPALGAVDDANPTAANWLRTAADAIAEAEAKAGRTLPAVALEEFAKDTKFAPSARRHAYELHVGQNPGAKGRLLPQFLNDPSPDLRRDAVADELERLDRSAPDIAKAGLQKLFPFTRDKDQVDAVAKKIGERGGKASVSEHFAFLTRWHLVGPFESEKGKALTTAYPPETAPDVTAAYKGKDGTALAWKAEATTDAYGMMDLNKLLGKHKNAAVYALAVVTAGKETPAEIRVASPNAVQIFLNGKKLFEREEYHHGDALDYHVGKGVLKAGDNTVVLKVCQNNQTDSWAQRWQFAARVCDATGGPLAGLAQVVPGSTPPKPIKLGTIPESATPTEEKK